MRICVIDIGSNTVKSAIYDSKDLVCVDRKTVHTSLLSYIENSSLTRDGFLVLENAVKRLSFGAASLGCERILAFATAALRMCDNASTVISDIAKSTGVHIDLISGEKEALLTYESAAASTKGMASDGICVDLGGGSCEIIHFGGGSIKSSVSLPLGSLLLYEKFVSNILPTAEEYDAAAEYVKKMLEENDCVPKTPNVYLIGGTARAALKVLSIQKPTPTLPAVISKKAVSDFVCDTLMLKKSAKLAIIGSVPERAHTLCMGLALFLSLADMTGADKFVITNASVRDGYLNERMSDL